MLDILKFGILATLNGRGTIIVAYQFSNVIPRKLPQTELKILKEKNKQIKRREK